MAFWQGVAVVLGCISVPTIVLCLFDLAGTTARRLRRQIG